MRNILKILFISLILPVFANAQSNTVRAYHSAAQSISNTTDTTISLDSEYYDYGNLHSTSTNNSRLTAAVAGVYRISGSVNFASNGTGIRVAYIRLNGTTDIAGQTGPSSGTNSTSLTVDTMYYLNANDYVTLVVYQSSGGSLNVNSSGNLSPELSMQLVGGQANGARAYNNSSQTISNTTDTAITLNSERYDYGNLHSTVTNTSRLTAQAGGVYHISASANFAANATGLRVIYIRLNGTTDICGQSSPGSASNSTSLSVNTLYYLNAGDYVEMYVYQASGGNLSINSSGNLSPELSMQLAQ